MNVKLLRKVAKRIKANAARFNMVHWGQRVDGDVQGMLKKPPCNTQACLAGETVLAAQAGYIPRGGGIKLRQKYAAQSIQHVAAKLLGLDSDLQRNTLFKFQRWSDWQGGWPQTFQRAYELAKTPKERAEIAAARIEHFIRTKGKE